MSIIVNNNSRKFITDFVGKRINSPEQRLIQGVTALAIQPVIDYNNDSADKQTRAVSVARTIGKILAGMATGVLIRYATIYLTKRFSQYTIQEIVKDKGAEFVKKIVPKAKKDIFMPTIHFEKPTLSPEKFQEKYNNYIKAMGTVVACFTMMFTNFLIDAPLTKFITKLLTPTIKEQIDEDKASEVK